MTATVVLDTAGVEAWAARRPSPDVLAVMEVLRRTADSRVLLPSVVAVEALTGHARDTPLLRMLAGIDIEEHLPLRHVRMAAMLRQTTDASAVDAVVGEAAARTSARYVITSDPEDIGALLDRAGADTVVITV